MHKFLSNILFLTILSGGPSLFASPLTFTSAGGVQTTTVHFDGNVATNFVAGLTSSATFSLLSVEDSGKKWNFQVLVAETGSVNARVAGLGFVNVTPNVNGGSVTNAGGTDWQFNFGSLQFPNQFGALEACLIDNNNNCNGGGNGGVANGSSATVLFNMTFASPQTVVTIAGMGVRYQSIVGVTAGSSGTGTEVVVPEPTTMGLMGLSLAALAVGYRRRKGSLIIPTTRH